MKNYRIENKLWVGFIKKETNQDIIKAANEKMSFIPQKLTQEDWDKAESDLSRSMLKVYHI